MPSVFQNYNTFLKIAVIFLGLTCLFGFLWSPSFGHMTNMESLDSSFTIEVDGKPIARPANDAEDRTPAKTGTEAAIFKLQDGRLLSGDWALSRNVTENRAFLPKPVLWFKLEEDTETRMKPVSAEQEGDSLKLKFAKAPLIADEEGNVLADLQGNDQSKVLVQQQ
ncbi:hypothetical protein K491DRAFT_687052 [Lophiostoma macrostomum CBS 122681]|uniref:Uncharacterized protein n=1 Tax=Lophiostoma macrostomum CBS 122681 TaxID=1314788 RepID=A0A6A6TQK3_9PLEO|nr:hypothetical protein K491DRAFT_687052 [Lophiostoma macrostomum CBS 122681]